MIYKIFTVKLIPGDTKELNTFLKSHKILNVKEYFVDNGTDSFISFRVEYIDKSEIEKSSKVKVDYKDVLSKEDFVLYSDLRDIRKSLAEEHGLPVYSIFTNEQLANILKAKPKTKEKLKSIPGVGDSKVEKYSERIIKYFDK